MSGPPRMDRALVATKRHVSCTVEGEAVILHLGDGVYYGLNDVGTRVWQLVQEPCNVDRIVDTIVAEFAVERERCARDVHELIDGLIERGLVSSAESASSE